MSIQSRVNSAVAMLDANSITQAQSVLILEGSIAEGFGNNASDIDIVMVEEEACQQERLPRVLFDGNIRIEFRKRSISSMREHIALVESPTLFARDGRKEHLDIYQRWTNALPLRNADVFGRVRQAMDRRKFLERLTEWHAVQCKRQIERARISIAVGARFRATIELRYALLAATKLRLARHGETYVPDKWVWSQIARTTPEFNQTFQDLYAFPRLSDFEAWSRSILECVGEELGAPQAIGGDGLVVRTRPTASTWPVGEATYVADRSTDEIVEMPGDLARFWRTLPRTGRLNDLLGRGDRSDSQALLRRLLRMGLIQIGGAAPDAWTGLRSLEPAPRGLLSAVGKDRGHETGRYLGSAATVAYSGAELTWAQINIENAFEDFRGALAAGQLGEARTALETALVWTAQGLLAAALESPLPANWDALPSACERFSDDQAFNRQIQDLLWSCHVPDQDLVALADDIRRFSHDTFERYGVGAFPASFDDRKAWARTMITAGQWARLISFMGLEYKTRLRNFPAEEIQELLSGEES